MGWQENPSPSYPSMQMHLKSINTKGTQVEQSPKQARLITSRLAKLLKQSRATSTQTHTQSHRGGCSMAACPWMCHKDWPCCVIEAADSVLVAVLGQPTRATVLGCLVTEFPGVAFLAGPGLTHPPTARPVVTDTMDTGTICQGHAVRSVSTKSPESTPVVDYQLSFTISCDTKWSSGLVFFDRGMSAERHPSQIEPGQGTDPVIAWVHIFYRL